MGVLAETTGDKDWALRLPGGGDVRFCTGNGTLTQSLLLGAVISDSISGAGPGRRRG